VHDVDARSAATDLATRFRHSMSLLTSGVAVVTVTVDGRPWGMTITACCSVTTGPPTVLVSLARTSVTAEAVVAQGEYGLCLMGADGRGTAEHCAAPGRPKFLDDGDHHQPCACRTPCARAAIAHLDCHLVGTVPVGDHLLLLGEVRAVCHPTDGAPLLYGLRDYQLAVPVHHIPAGGSEHWALTASAW
jgi:flavin reductase (DIM6/NTAB) family NADH-FMN oxidoreductase RutF